MRHEHRKIRMGIISIIFLVLLAAIIGSGASFYKYQTLKYNVPYEKEILAYSKQYGSDPALLTALISYETNFKNKEYQPNQLNGLILLKDTSAQVFAEIMGWKQFTPSMLANPDHAIHMGAFMISHWEKAGKTQKEITRAFLLRNKDAQFKQDKTFQTAYEEIQKKYEKYQRLFK
ncbi:transglycosylase SLT domain-containing protein [Brevibacillus laterosporus]|uniref:transglycosylase SLT domain-containing protein n=2 Tax=Brevibacillus laterosporus TaxID=1465 RepID=UPI000E6CFB57|nr:transglycosylase SLT domain-containing protein [Brevibacillus laterosporus]AYB40485.1 hypothetical protein D5F52_20880 [Brevibacillus laterosporus]MBG9774054.1 hypothetical protein [Brevibacillus laterosporus]MBG9797613.1 hypothetical protein [Brevibacillus laterosporus]MBM7110136.1 Endo-type membrane-bound lytic murein transglycosylase A [Brevibacillus laterosporus]MCR8936718.1 transglycosylase SLT domain-containing protein [Brevibacillus laterosporus]